MSRVMAELLRLQVAVWRLLPHGLESALQRAVRGARKHVGYVGAIAARRVLWRALRDLAVGRDSEPRLCAHTRRFLEKVEGSMSDAHTSEKGLFLSLSLSRVRVVCLRHAGKNLSLSLSLSLSCE